MEYEFLQLGWFREDQVSLHVVPGMRIYPADCWEGIESAWTDAHREPNPHLWDGPALSLRYSLIEGGNLIVAVQATSYKAYWGTNLAHPGEHRSDFADILAVCGVCVTSDGFVPVGLRSRQVAEGRECWHVPGGNMETADHGPFEIMRMELREELGIGTEDIAEMFCTGMARSSEHYKPEFLFLARLCIDAETLRERIGTASDAAEHTRIEMVSVESLEAFFRDHRSVKIGKAAVSAAIARIVLPRLSE